MVAVPKELEETFNELLPYGKVQFHRTSSPLIRAIIASDYMIEVKTSDDRFASIEVGLYVLNGMEVVAVHDHSVGFPYGYRRFKTAGQVALCYIELTKMLTLD